MGLTPAEEVEETESVEQREDDRLIHISLHSVDFKGESKSRDCRRKTHASCLASLACLSVYLYISVEYLLRFASTVMGAADR